MNENTRKTQLIHTFLCAFAPLREIQLTFLCKSAFRATLILAAALAVAGCTRTPPPITPVEGVVLLDGKPLAKAHVEFVPDLKNCGAELISMGTTDEEGKFQLTCTLKSQPGAVVAKHRVIVFEEPVSADMRGMDAESQAKLAAYMHSLRNRPIPEEYGSVVKTPIMVEVTKDQRTYEIKLVRR